MTINDVTGEGCIMYELLREFLGHKFVSGLRALKSKNLKTKKFYLIKLGFFQPWSQATSCIS